MRIPKAVRIGSLVVLVAVLAVGTYHLYSQSNDKKPPVRLGQHGHAFQEVIRVPAKGKYLLYVPESYAKKKSWPLILFLHGSGERGKDVNYRYGMSIEAVGVKSVEEWAQDHHTLKNGKPIRGGSTIFEKASIFILVDESDNAFRVFKWPGDKARLGVWPLDRLGEFLTDALKKTSVTRDVCQSKLRHYWTRA